MVPGPQCLVSVSGMTGWPGWPEGEVCWNFYSLLRALSAFSCTWMNDRAGEITQTRRNVWREGEVVGEKERMRSRANNRFPDFLHWLLLPAAGRARLIFALISTNLFQDSSSQLPFCLKCLFILFRWLYNEPWRS